MALFYEYWEDLEDEMFFPSGAEVRCSECDTSYYENDGHTCPEDRMEDVKHDKIEMHPRVSAEDLMGTFVEGDQG